MNSTPQSAKITGLYVGRIENLWPGKQPSAIAKRPVEGPLLLTRAGFKADAQADLKNHGGFEKAVHHYPAEHYPTWQAELGDIAREFGPGQFGENISTIGLTEENLFIGDVLRMGSAVVQISQGRQPCWKLNAHTCNDKMAYLVQKTVRTGWYYRVMEDGEVNLGDEISLLSRPNPDWSVKLVTGARFNGKISPELARAISEIPELYEGWRTAFMKKSDSQFVENQKARLTGDP